MAATLATLLKSTHCAFIAMRLNPFEIVWMCIGLFQNDTYFNLEPQLTTDGRKGVGQIYILAETNN